MSPLDLAFKVTFTNSGDFQEVKVPVTLTVYKFKQKLYGKTEQVPVIETGQTKTVAFTNLALPTAAFSANATVTAVIGKVPGETVLSNNHASYPVFFSLPSG